MASFPTTPGGVHAHFRRDRATAPNPPAQTIWKIPGWIDEEGRKWVAAAEGDTHAAADFISDLRGTGRIGGAQVLLWFAMPVRESGDAENTGATAPWPAAGDQIALGFRTGTIQEIGHERQYRSGYAVATLE